MLTVFAVNCPRHGRRVLLSVADIERLEHRPGGLIDVHFRCTCGYRGVWRTGAGAEAAAAGVRPTSRGARAVAG